MNQILSPEKFLQILSHYLLDTNEGFIVVDAESEDQPIVYVNRGFTNMTGYSPEEIIGKEINYLFGVESSSEDLKNLNNAITNNKKISFSTLINKKDDSSFWSLCSLSPIYNSAGDITHYSITLNDVTVQKHNAEYNSLKSTLETVNDIVFNYMSYLNELRMELKDIFSADTNDEQNNLLKEFDVEYSDTIKKLLALDQIKDYKEKRVGEKVTLLNLE